MVGREGREGGGDGGSGGRRGRGGGGGGWDGRGGRGKGEERRMGKERVDRQSRRPTPVLVQATAAVVMRLFVSGRMRLFVCVGNRLSERHLSEERDRAQFR
jgi:hypothetical protein